MHYPNDNLVTFSLLSSQKLLAVVYFVACWFLADGWQFFLSCFRLFGRINHLFLFLPVSGFVPKCLGTIWGALCFSYRTSEIKIFIFSSRTHWQTSNDYLQFLVQRDKLQFAAGLTLDFVVRSIWLQLMHLLPKCTSMTLYNYSILSLYFILGSTQCS